MHARKDVILNKTGIGKIEALIGVKGHDRRIAQDPMAQDIAEMLGAGNKTHFGNMRPETAIEVQTDREDHTDRNSGFNSETERQQNGASHGGKQARSA